MCVVYDTALWGLYEIQVIRDNKKLIKIAELMPEFNLLLKIYDFKQVQILCSSKATDYICHWSFSELSLVRLKKVISLKLHR